MPMVSSGMIKMGTTTMEISVRRSRRESINSLR